MSKEQKSYDWHLSSASLSSFDVMETWSEIEIAAPEFTDGRIHAEVYRSDGGFWVQRCKGAE